MNSGDKPILIVVTGPTASGKSDLAVELASHFGCDIIGADSRQIYRGIPIGTAVPSAEQRRAVRHHFVETLELTDYYSAARYADDVAALLPRLWKQSEVQVMCGGSMMYIDAVTNGIDNLPTISEAVRAAATDIYTREGLDGLRERVKHLDPAYYATADLNNHRRLIHAIEICMEAGVPYSTLRTGVAAPRDFRVVKVAIGMDRETLFGRINSRVDKMIAAGLEEEARSVSHLRHLNALNTVGYKEMFAMFDGTMDRATAIARMAKNTRVYAKKQATWLSRPGAATPVVWLDATDPLTDFFNKNPELKRI